MKRVLVVMAWVVAVPAGMLLTLVCTILLVYYGGAAVMALLERHRTVTEEMVWQCVSIEDTGNPQFSHSETARLWFVKNPHYEVTDSGPHLCADLKATGRKHVSVSFPVSGSRWQGLRSYDTIVISAGSKKVDTYGAGVGSAEFHGDIEHPEDEPGLAYPDIRRNPLEVFK